MPQFLYLIHTEMGTQYRFKHIKRFQITLVIRTKHNISVQSDERKQ